MKIYAPVTGNVVALKDIPDPVFAEKILGDGLAIESSEEKKDVVTAPISGKITTLNKNLHAAVIQGKDGTEVLVHIGVDTVKLGGKGFKALVKEGATVSQGDPLIKIDLHHIRKNAPASMVIVLLTDQPEVSVTATNQTKVKAGDLMFSFNEEDSTKPVNATVSSAEQPVAETENGVEEEKIISDWVVISNPNGIHARPAANLAKQANRFVGSDIEIEKEGGNKSNAKSSTGIMRLDLGFNSKARFISTDEKAIEELIFYLTSGSGEDIKSQATTAHLKAPAQTTEAGTNNAALSFDKEQKVKLNVASPGLALGQAFVIIRKERKIPETTKNSVVQEQDLLTEALAAAVHAIKLDMETSSDEAKAILDAHLSFLEDPGLRASAVELVKNGKSAAYAWEQVTATEAAALTKSDNAYMAARAADMRDVGDRVINALLGEEATPEYPENSIVIADDLTPSTVTNFTKNVVGVVTILGSPTGHAAIMMRNSGIPSFFNAPHNILKAPQGHKIIIDTEKKLLILAPTEELISKYQKKITTINKGKEEAFANAKALGATKDGYRVEISGNVSSVAEGVKASAQGGEGYGLARSEFLFYGRQTSPTEEEQRALYQGLLDATEHDLTVRLLDAGGDKPIVYVKVPKEDNPLLGIRGMRIHEDNPEIYRTQIRALLQCKPVKRIKIMVPMIALVPEVDQIRAVFDDEMAKMGIKKEDGPRFGIMAETPAVMAMAEQFAQKVDFFSVGTNDLAQYTLAMDRTSARLASISNASNPAILKLIGMLCEGASKYNVPVAVCGAAASDPITALLFVGLGVKELAVSGIEVPQIKATLRRYTLAELQTLAKEATTLSTDAEVVALVKKRCNLE